MNLDQLQTERNSWVSENFKRHGQPIDTMECVLGAVEEVGELAHQIIKRLQGIRPEKDRKAKIMDACGDVIVYLAGVATNEGFLLSQALQDAWDDVRMRDWRTNPIDGTNTLKPPQAAEQVTEQLGQHDIGHEVLTVQVVCLKCNARDGEPHGEKCSSPFTHFYVDPDDPRRKLRP